jgi:hypothetical protein
VLENPSGRSRWNLPRQYAGLTYAFLSNARLPALADGCKPIPFPTRRGSSSPNCGKPWIGSKPIPALLDQKDQVRSATETTRAATGRTSAGAAGPKRPRVVFLGDSITDGWRLNEYFTARDFVNRNSGQIGEMGRMVDVII